MAETRITLLAAPALGGAEITIGGNRIKEKVGLALVSVATPIGGEAALARSVHDGWDLDLPGAAQSSVSRGVRAVWLAADQYLFMLEDAGPDPEKSVQEKLDSTGYTTDQTDAWVALEISGPQTLNALERLCPLDIAQFDDGAAARTVMEHMGALIVRLSADSFLLLSARSSGRSFLHAVETSYRNVT